MSCDSGGGGSAPAPTSTTDPELNGTWAYSDDDDVITLVFNNGTYEYFSHYPAPDTKGTFTTSGSTLTITRTHGWGKMLNASLDAKWYSKADLKKPDVLAILDVTAADVDERFGDPVTGTYSISGNRLTIAWERGFSETYTKQ